MVEAIAAAIDAALQSPEMAEIVNNSVKRDPLYLGAQGTRDLLLCGLENVTILFQK